MKSVENKIIFNYLDTKPDIFEVQKGMRLMRLEVKSGEYNISSQLFYSLTLFVKLQ